MSIQRSVAVVGASGFTGAELLRLLAMHPWLRLVRATGDTMAGTPARQLYPSLAAAYPDLVYEAFEPELVDGLDLVVLGLPHEASMELVPQLSDRVGCIVDLSAAFRLRDPGAYPRYYGFEHSRPDLLERAVYGLPEAHRDELAGADLIATPGCYVTAATLALRPLVAAGAIVAEGIVVDAASGVSGAGRGAKEATSFTTVDENLTAYGLIDHRHTPEMEQEIGAQLLFTPHLAPMNRGILATCYARPTDPTATTADVLGVLAAAYRDEPFVVVDEASPSTKSTLGANTAHLTARVDPRTGYVLVLAALDNLTKGASGGALQAANVALGLDETAGLPTAGVAP